MCAKYSAEWWEKIPDINREISSRIEDDSDICHFWRHTISTRRMTTAAAVCGHLRSIQVLAAFKKAHAKPQK